MMPPGALLPDPFSITGDPAITTWFGPGFAMGGGCKKFRLLAKPEGEGDDGGARMKGVLDGLYGCSRRTVLLRPG